MLLETEAFSLNDMLYKWKFLEQYTLKQVNYLSSDTIMKILLHR